MKVTKLKKTKKEALVPGEVKVTKDLKKNLAILSNAVRNKKVRNAIRDIHLNFKAIQKFRKGKKITEKEYRDALKFAQTIEALPFTAEVAVDGINDLIEQGE